MKTLGILTISLLLFLFSCKKDSFITSPDARVTITADTLRYDTVFVTAGSIYRTFKIINENDQKLRISSLKLFGGVASVYKMNVNGIPGTLFNNLELNANDSIYVFTQVNVNPNAANLPFILRDSIEIVYNGEKKQVQLEAWGQNAHFFRDKVISANETWNNDLPYVILGSLFINTNQTLTINKGCRIYVHADAPIIVDGTLQVNGLKDTIDRVYFRGDRLDDPYKDYPASWPGIFFRSPSKDNILNYAILKNAYQAIALQNLAPNNPVPKLILNECVIDNSYDAGIIAFNSSIRARNCLISNCGKNLYLVQGGNYQFTHCTVATYSSNFIDHKDPVLTLSDFANNSSNTLDATFRNCIFWGENKKGDSSEVVIQKRGSNTFNVIFAHSLWKVFGTPANINAPVAMITNQSPRFDSINTSKNYYDFRLKALPVPSPAINNGAVIAGISTDLDGKPRHLGSAPDIGCFEKQ